MESFEGIIVFLLICLVLTVSISGNENSRSNDNVAKLDLEKITIRVNTFRRLDLLKYFITHYSQCSSVVEEIQVVWSDVKENPPYDWIKDFIAPDSNHKKTTRVTVEEHKENSLSNRFRVLIPVTTAAVLTIDDDIIISCEDLSLLHQTWLVNQQVIVGISPRLHRYHADGDGSIQYLNWQYTWWNGEYSIMLTKASLMHQRYLFAYDREIPPLLSQFIDKNRNCEDIAIAYITTKTSKAAPVWASVTFYDIASSGISSKVTTHFTKRGDCLQIIEDYEKALLIESHSKQVKDSQSEEVKDESDCYWSWRIGYQKVVALSWWNTWSLLWYDTK